MRKMALAIAVAVVLSACATKGEQAGIGDIAATPLRDLNLTPTEIPAALRDALDKPYAIPASQDCPILVSQIALLDELLGPDLDVPHEKQGFQTAAREMTGKAVAGALQNTVEGAIPFRGWLRKLSGAERHSKQVQDAVLAGKIRRGFLKGMLRAHDCTQAS